MTPRAAAARRSSGKDRVRVADVVGVPRLPPAAATAGMERVRAGLASVHRRLVPPPVRILDAMLAPLDAVVLGAICRLGVPAELRGAVEIHDLAARLDLDEERLTRLVRYAHTRGWLRLDRRGRVRPTRTTRFLRRDHAGGWAGWVDFACDPEVLGALAALGQDPRAGDPYEVANGASFFESIGRASRAPGRVRRGDGRRRADARARARLGARLVDALDAVCDVGGGSGELLRVLLATHRHLEGVLIDLPVVTARAPATEGLTVRPADAFSYAEPGCDRYLLVNVLHDWDDADAVRLLETVRRVAPERAEVIVVEAERLARPRPAIALSTDLLMMALTPGGRERTTAEIAGLAERSGWKHVHCVALASGDRAHTLRFPAT